MEKKYINDKMLNEDQLEVLYNDDKYLLVVAGAGSGKTFTIVAKIKYLIEIKDINPKEILCISFTNEAVENLKSRLNNDEIDVMTFHKLGINILKDNNVSYTLCDDTYLDYIIHEFFYGVIFESSFLMRAVLSYFKCFCIFNIDKKYSSFIHKNKNKMSKLERLISRFIQLFKTNGFSSNLFGAFIKKSLFRKEKLLLIIILNVYLIYKNELDSSNKIDLDDILIKSNNIINNGGLVKNYKYIIIDEYQDTSFIRFNLIKIIISITNSRFIAVGDDFQSIYKFSGCDLDIFINFDKLFEGATILKLRSTYRNSQELITIAGEFIMKSKRQFVKDLKSNKSIDFPIVICSHTSLKTILDELEGRVMILGRNNRDLDYYLDEELVIKGNTVFYNNNPSIQIEYYTVHSSKGLEADNVIILNVIDDTLGFPNKISDNKIIRFVSKRDFLYEEERRLFYVALTRTKNRVYILTEKGRESIFVKEIIKKRHVKCRL